MLAILIEGKHHSQDGDKAAFRTASDKFRDYFIHAEMLANFEQIRPDSGDNVKRKIRDFLNNNVPSHGTVIDLLLYYVGHGKLNPLNDEDYCLLTDNPEDPFIWLNFSELVYVIDSIVPGDLRLFCIIDACHSGASIKSFQLTRRRTNNTNGPVYTRGITVLCSASSRDQSKLADQPVPGPGIKCSCHTIKSRKSR